MCDESLDESLNVNKYTNTTKEGRHVYSTPQCSILSHYSLNLVKVLLFV